jgi:hypothetical protein
MDVIPSFPYQSAMPAPDIFVFMDKMVSGAELEYFACLQYYPIDFERLVEGPQMGRLVLEVHQYLLVKNNHRRRLGVGIKWALG